MIKLDRIAVRNYRSIKEIEFTLDSFVAFVGYNNSGKSNCMRAINWVLSMEKPTLEDYYVGEEGKCGEPPSAEYRLSGLTDEILDELVDDEGKRKKIKQMRIGDKLYLKREFVSGKPRTFYKIDDEWKINPSGVDTAIKSIHPDVFLIEPDMNSSEQAGKVKSGTALSNLMAFLVKESLKKYEETLLDFKNKLFLDDSVRELELGINRALKSYYPGFDVSLQNNFEINDVFKSFSLEVKEDGSLKSLSNYGHGLQRSALMAVLTFLASVSQISVGLKTRVLLIDEPELFQHPSMIKKIRETLLDLSEVGFQVVITTHSPHLLSAEKVIRRTYAVSKNVEQGTFLRNPSLALEKKFNSKTLSNFLALDQLSYVPFSERVMVVEGGTEEVFFKTILEDLFSESFHKYSVFKMDGCKQFPYAKDFLDFYGFPIMLVGDLDAIKSFRVDDDTVQEKINCIRVKALEYFKEKGCPVDKSGWPIGNSSEKFNEFSLSDFARKKELLNDLRWLDCKNIHFWSRGDIEHTLYPNFVDGEKIERVRRLIKKVREVQCSISPWDAWKKVIEGLGGDFNELHKLLIRFADTAITFKGEEEVR